MSEWIASTLLRVTRDLDVFQDRRTVPIDIIDAYNLSVELVNHELNLIVKERVIRAKKRHVTLWAEH